jgi:hypothetical protein
MGFDSAIIFPFCRAEHRSVYWEQPVRVAAWMRRVGKGTGSPFCQPPVNALERRKQAAVGWPFLWLLSFGHAKESNSPVGARTDIKISLATRNLCYQLLKFFTQCRWYCVHQLNKHEAE